MVVHHSVRVPHALSAPHALSVPHDALNVLITAVHKSPNVFIDLIMFVIVNPVVLYVILIVSWIVSIHG
jgi:hypothetical protein